MARSQGWSAAEPRVSQPGAPHSPPRSPPPPSPNHTTHRLPFLAASDLSRVALDKTTQTQRPLGELDPAAPQPHPSYFGSSPLPYTQSTFSGHRKPLHFPRGPPSFSPPGLAPRQLPLPQIHSLSPFCVQPTLLILRDRPRHHTPRSPGYSHLQDCVWFLPVYPGPGTV